MSVEFCDTNIIVYAYDATAGAKRERAALLLERLWREGAGVLSVQLLQELFVTLTRKIPRPLSTPEARGIVSDLASWSVVEPASMDVLAAIDVAERWRVSFWDAMIIRTAQRAGATVLWSEDLAPGQSFDGVTVSDPFRG
jgi:predicted nucleic acid-binding protein